MEQTGYGYGATATADSPNGSARRPGRPPRAEAPERKPAEREKSPPVSSEKPEKPKKPPLKPPTFEYLLDLKRELETLYEKQDEQIRVMRQVRELLDPVPVDPDVRLVDVEVRVPILTDNVQRTVAIMGVNPPELQVKPSREDDDAQANSTRRERATKGILEMAGRNAGGPPTYLMAIDSAVADGGAWTKLVPNWDDWDDVYAICRDDYEDDPYPEARDGESSDDYARRLNRVRTKDEKYQRARTEAKKRSGVPFRWVQVDVATIYPSFGEGKVREVLEVTKRVKSQCFRQYRLKTGRDGKILRSGQSDRSRSNTGLVPEELGPRMSEDEADQIDASSTIDFLEHHDSYFCTLAVIGTDNAGGTTGQVVDQWEHKNGRHPYFFAPGLWMNHWRHRKVGWGVSESMRWLIRYLSYLLTVHANIAAREAFTPLQEVLPDQAAPLLGENDRPRTGTPEPEKWQLGRIYRSTRPGSELRPINFSRAAEEIKEQVRIVMDLVEQLLTPRVQSQIGGNMEGAGFAIAQVLAEGRIRHDPIAQGIERMLDEVTQFLWHLIRTRVKEEVWVGTEAGETAPYESLGPDDLEEAVRIRWTVNAETPSAELLRARYWGERLANHTASLDQAIEGMGDNPDEVRFGLLMDRIRSHPAFQAWQIQMVFAEAERGDVLTSFEDSQLAGMAQTGGVPGPDGSVPGMPGMPPPGMGPPGSMPAMPGAPPDIGQLALAPGGAGAGTVPGPFPPVGGPGPLPGPMGTGPGIGPGATMPGQAAQAQLQNLGP